MVVMSECCAHAAGVLWEPHMLRMECGWGVRGCGRGGRSGDGVQRNGAAGGGLV